jgi:hypothetical protein
LESTIVRNILAYLNGLEGCKAIKIHGSLYMEAGTPDIIGSYHGFMFLLEVKRPSGKATGIQLARMRQWGDTRAFVKIVRSREEAHGVILELRDYVERLLIPLKQDILPLGYESRPRLRGATEDGLELTDG